MFKLSIFILDSSWACFNIFNATISWAEMSQVTGTHQLLLLTVEVDQGASFAKEAVAAVATSSAGKPMDPPSFRAVIAVTCHDFSALLVGHARYASVNMQVS